MKNLIQNLVIFFLERFQNYRNNFLESFNLCFLINRLKSLGNFEKKL